MSLSLSSKPNTSAFSWICAGLVDLGNTPVTLCVDSFKIPLDRHCMHAVCACACVRACVCVCENLQVPYTHFVFAVRGEQRHPPKLKVQKHLHQDTTKGISP